METAQESKSTLLSRSLQSLFATAGSRLVMFLAGIVLARLLGPTDLGVLTLLVTIGTFVSSLTALGVPQAATKFVSERNDLAPSVLRASVFLILALSLVGFLVLLLGARWVAQDLYGEPLLVPLLTMIAAFIIANNVFLLSQSLLQGTGAIGSYNLVTITSTVVYFILVSLGAWLFGLKGVVWAVVVNALIGIALSITYLLRTKKSLPALGWQRNDWSEAKPILRYGAFLTAGGLMANAALWYAPTLLVHAHGFASLGYFRVANLVTSNLLIIPTAVAIPLFPALSGTYASNRTRFTELAKNSFALVALATLPIAVLCCLFSEELLLLLVGTEYSQGWDIVFLMSVAGFLMAVNSIAGAVFYGAGEMGHSMVINAVWGVVFAGVAWMLVPLLSSLGLALAYVLSYGVMTVIQFQYQSRRWEIRFRYTSLATLAIALLFFGCYVLKVYVHGMAFYVSSVGIVLVLALVMLRVVLADPRLASILPASIVGRMRPLNRG